MASHDLSGPMRGSALGEQTRRFVSAPELERPEELMAGSPMTYPCRDCGHVADIKPENWFLAPPRERCGECQVIFERGWRRDRSLEQVLICARAHRRVCLAHGVDVGAWQADPDAAQHTALTGRALQSAARSWVADLAERSGPEPSAVELHRTDDERRWSIIEVTGPLEEVLRQVPPEALELACRGTAHRWLRVTLTCDGVHAAPV